MGRLLETHFFRKKRDRVDVALTKVALFRGLTPKQIKKLVKKCYLRRYEKGEFVFYKNEPAYGLFVILRGSVAIKVRDRKVGSYEKYQAFGEFSLIRDATRAADAVTEGPATLCYLFKEDLRKLFLADPKMCITIYQNLLKSAVATIKRV